jgi:hypothetical protein
LCSAVADPMDNVLRRCRASIQEKMCTSTALRLPSGCGIAVTPTNEFCLMSDFATSGLHPCIFICAKSFAITMKAAGA